MPTIHHLPLVAEPASTMHAFARASGLEALAEWIEGDNFVVCDLGVHGAGGCAAIRDAILRQHLVAEWVSLGLCLFVAVLVGSLATVFVRLFGRAFASVRGRRQVAVSVATTDGPATIAGAA